MPIAFNCSCGEPLEADAEYAGRMTRCPRCGRELQIPSAPVTEESVSANICAPTTSSRELHQDDLAPFEPTPKNTLATPALALGILSFCLPWLLSIPALVIGIVALTRSNRAAGQSGGRGLAIAGIVMACLSLLEPFVLLPYGVWRVREAAERVKSTNNMRQIILAMHNYHDNHMRLPPAVVYDEKGTPLYSWRVLLLPYLGADDVYRAFHLDEPWDSPHNRSLLSQMAFSYADPASDADPTLTRYQLFVGPGAVFENMPVGNQPLRIERARRELRGPRYIARFTDVSDGSSQTVILGEAADPVPWSKPEDMPFHPDGTVPRLHERRSGPLVGFLDSVVIPLPKDVTAQEFRALITRAGDEVIPERIRAR